MGWHIGLHTTSQYTPAQLIFGRNSIINRRQDVKATNAKIVIEEITRTNKETMSYLKSCGRLNPIRTPT